MAVCVNCSPARRCRSNTDGSNGNQHGQSEITHKARTEAQSVRKGRASYNTHTPTTNASTLKLNPELSTRCVLAGWAGMKARINWKDSGFPFISSLQLRFGDRLELPPHLGCAFSAFCCRCVCLPSPTPAAKPNKCT